MESGVAYLSAGYMIFTVLSKVHLKPERVTIKINLYIQLYFLPEADVVARAWHD